MPRMPREKSYCGTFHITARGNNKMPIFRRNVDFRYFKNLILKYKKKQNFLLYHYALMKNHIHLCLKANEGTDISKLMQGLLLSYNHYQRIRNGYAGHLWQGRFFSKLIKEDAYLITVGIYIEKNPVEAGVVKDPMEYSWSSYRYYALNKADPLINADPLYELLGTSSEERRKSYIELMHSWMQKLSP